MPKFRTSAFLLLLAFGSAAYAQSVTGDWLTDDRKGIIRVAPCGSHMCGTILRVLDPTAPANDINDPDPEKRAHPLIGTQVLTDFSPSDKGWDGGMAYDPKVGRRYRSSMALDGPDRLAITGCITFLCRTKTWTRADRTAEATYRKTPSTN